MRRYFRFAAAMAALFAPLVLQSVHAQGLYGSLVGNVTDASIAGIPGAKVRITNVENQPGA